MRTMTDERRPAWWRRVIARLGVMGSTVLAIVLIAAVVALAAIVLRAEVTGSAGTGGAIAFEWGADDGTQTGTYADGSVPTVYMLDGDNDGNWDSQQPMPAPLVCTANVVGGELQVNMSGGWLPGEGCGILTTLLQGLGLKNPSGVDVDIIDWDFGISDAGLPASGAPVEFYVNTGQGGGFTPASLPSFVAAGTSVSAGSLIVQLATNAPFSATFTIDGTAVIGQTTR